MRWNPFRAARKAAPRRTVLTLEEFEPRIQPSVDVLTYHNDNARTGQDLSEPFLTPANVNSSTFGKLFVLPVDGKVDAQPLYVASVAIPGKGTHNVLFVATEHDSVYAFDADSATGGNATPLWHASFINGTSIVTVPSSDVNCTQVTPELGITDTPVIDPATGTLYVVAMTKVVTGSSVGYAQTLHALDIHTGADKITPASVQAQVPGTGDGGSVDVFNPKSYKERPGLLLLNGVVYTTWSSHCDEGVYHGWVIAYNAQNLAPVAVFNVTPDGNEASIWASGAAPAADAAGSIYFLSGNGSFDANAGLPDFGDTMLKLSTANGLGVADYFTPSDQARLAANDLDLGSGGTLVLPDGAGGAAHPNLVIGAGKEGTIYLVDRNNMGHFSPTSDNIVQELPGAIGSSFGMPAYFNGTIYYGGVNDNLKAFTLVNGLLTTSPTSRSPTTFSYPGTTPSISANGTTNGIVWAAENGSTAVLRAYDASNLAHELYNSNQAGTRDQFGTGNKFITPTVANGKVYVGTTSGVGVFGLFGSIPAPPTNLAAGVSGSQVSLTWTGVTGATGYNVYRGTISGDESLTPLAAGLTTTSFTDTTAAAGVTYFYEVTAVNANGESAGSNEVTAHVVSADERFVQALYVTFLGRPGSSPEWDGWVAALPRVGRAGVADLIQHSNEALTRLVDGFYSRFLNRSPAGGEAAGWVNALAHGATEEQVIAGILASGEFAADANRLVGSANADDNFVQALYMLVLNRPANAVNGNDVSAWAGGLPALGRAGVALDFLTLAEFRVGAVRTFYGDPTLTPSPYQPFLPNLLHRQAAPTSGEVGGWVNSGFDLLLIEDLIAGSAEFYALANS